MAWNLQISLLGAVFNTAYLRRARDRAPLRERLGLARCPFQHTRCSLLQKLSAGAILPGTREAIVICHIQRQQPNDYFTNNRKQKNTSHSTTSPILTDTEQNIPCYKGRERVSGHNFEHDEDKTYSSHLVFRSN